MITAKLSTIPVMAIQHLFALSHDFNPNTIPLRTAIGNSKRNLPKWAISLSKSGVKSEKAREKQIKPIITDAMAIFLTSHQ